eukprot:CAMPEP_0114553968 /NCGR_PEP_ID=MMETSP0114-20121206/7955_1 /TAXON_ID=31324 /ORGANISM="Goniomonas sp, Strain m" /LENGTH=359 /DNA_ID=CAMNT_0001738975 /DNA_START=87 /DNA_END=1166 /DNA_ORIENTATION=+
MGSSGMANTEALALAEQCLPRLTAMGCSTVDSIASVSSSLIQGLWTGMGDIVEISVRGSNGAESSFVAKLIGPPKNPEDFGEKRDHASYNVEACFYEQGHADRLCDAGALCPRPIFIERKPGGFVTICMTLLPGSTRSRVGQAQTCSGLSWLAKLHATYWGHARADAAVKSGLQHQGCFWHLDTRHKELKNMSKEGVSGRLHLAAAAIDARMKADPMQTIVHGDPKVANMMFDQAGEASFLDFQWIGKAAASKDLAYCFCTAASSLTEDDEAVYLQHYHRELSKLLTAQGDQPPSLEAVRESYYLAAADLYRWMAGWGTWGNADVLKKHAKTVLQRLDGGTPLPSPEAYSEAMSRAYPV